MSFTIFFIGATIKTDNSRLNAEEFALRDFVTNCKIQVAEKIAELCSLINFFRHFNLIPITSCDIIAKKDAAVNYPNYPTNLSFQISWWIPRMRIRIDMRLQLCGNDRLACIELQLLTDRPTGAAYVHTGCCNIVSDTGSLRGKVGVLKTRLQKVERK